MIEGPEPIAIRLEAGSTADLDEVIIVMKQAFDDRFGEAWTRSQCAGILPMPGVALIVARDGQTAIGFSLSRIIAGEAELLLLAVAPDHRRRKVGSVLLDQFLDRARENGANRVHLEVRDGNPAVKMYRAAGFHAAGRRRKYYRGRDGGEFDALTFTTTV
ncbi:ribosomal protein S18-alanine N-acetyltransferase [Sphingomonas sp.]|uniref:ribosomal protein S18-alanine N-acetyltransferase n=1 Tax=Sphingomonas sp. TaxID=28214 RepID=UPI00286E08FD|nr:ribosomal protein S18-alanine N-acetyltransferase [Sphingomonas sp.]